jgi:hypothetical protein
MTTETTTANEGNAAPAQATSVAVEGVAPEVVVAGAETAAPAGEAASAPVRPEGLPDEFWDDATGVKAGDVWSALRDLKAAQEAKTADLPKDGEAYDLALPADLVLPEGAEVVINKDDPLWADFQAIARESGVGKAGFQKFVGAFAKYQAAAQVADVETYTAEMGKLGANAVARRDSAANYLKANLSTAQAEALGGALISADGIAALETIIRLKSGPVAATGVGASAGSSEFEGTHGASRLEAIRAKQAA